MLRMLGRVIGLTTEKSTAPVAHEAQRDSRQEAKRDISVPESKMQLVLTARPDPSFHHYLDLPPALLALIAIFWNQEELRQCNHALVGFYCFRVLPPAAPGDKTHNGHLYPPVETFLHRQFQVVHRETRLLRAVIDADYYSQAQAAVDQDPSLMFKPVYFKYRDGSSECISPLKYAFKVYDTYMWTLFYEKIKENPQYVKTFLKQAQEQTKHIDLAPLFAAYAEYEKQDALWLTNKITDEKPLNAAWLKLGAAQRLILPAHMLKEFAREGDTWSASIFNVKIIKQPPSNYRIYDCPAGTWRALSSTISDPGWGSSFSLIRARSPYPSLSLTPRWTSVDATSFRRLFEVRVEDLAKQISLLSQNSHTSPELQTQSSFSASRVVP